MNFTAPYSKSECVKRFRACVDAPWRLNGAEPIIGWTRLGTLHACKRIGYRNAFQTVLTARLRPFGDGVHVALSSGLSGIAAVILGVWFGGLGLAVVATTFSDAPNSAAIPALMIAFGVGLVAFGRWLARDEAAYLTAFLVETLDLEQVD